MGVSRLFLIAALALSLAPPALAKDFRLFGAEGTPVSDYDALIDEIQRRGDPTDVIIDGQGGRHPVLKILGKGNTTLVIDVGGGWAERFPLSRRSLASRWGTHHAPSGDGTQYNSWYAETYPDLARWGIPTVGVDLANSRPPQFIRVEKLNLLPVVLSEGAAPQTITLEDFFKNESRIESGLKKEMQNKLEEFVRKLARASQIGDFYPVQIAWTDRGWVLMDWTNGQTRAGWPEDRNPFEKASKDFMSPRVFDWTTGILFDERTKIIERALADIDSSDNDTFTRAMEDLTALSPARNLGLRTRVLKIQDPARLQLLLNAWLEKSAPKNPWQGHILNILRTSVRPSLATSLKLDLCFGLASAHEKAVELVRQGNPYALEAISNVRDYSSKGGRDFFEAILDVALGQNSVPPEARERALAILKKMGFADPRIDARVVRQIFAGNEVAARMAETAELQLKTLVELTRLATQSNVDAIRVLATRERGELLRKAGYFDRDLVAGLTWVSADPGQADDVRRAARLLRSYAPLGMRLPFCLREVARMKIPRPSVPDTLPPPVK